MAIVNQGQPLTLARQVYEGLCREITTGKLRPGAVLSRRKIAAAYGTSYVPVIEAMVRLENTGLIEAQSAQMARVRKVTPETIEHTYVLREAVETQTIRLACQNATSEEIDELYRLAAEVEARVPSRESSPDEIACDEGPLLHWLFHCRIAEISRCPLLVQELERIELLCRLRANWKYIPGLDEPPRRHARLVDAIKAGDALAADAAMRAHIRSGLEKELRTYRIQAANPRD